MDILSFELGKKLGGGGQPSPTPTPTPTPTPSTGYVEDIMAYYDGTDKSLKVTNEELIATDSGGKEYGYVLNSSDGATIEAYIRMDGASSSSTYSRAFSVNDTSFCVAFANGGGSSDSNYHYNPMIISWGGSLDYEIYPNGLKYGDKHTFSIVSTPDPNEQDANTVTFFVDGEQVGEEKTMSRGSSVTINRFIVEGSTARPLNGELLNGRFYNRALTAAELAANHANDVAKYGGNG